MTRLRAHRRPPLAVGGKTEPQVGSPEPRVEPGVLVQARDGPGWPRGGAGRERGVGGLLPCLPSVGLIASGVYLSVDRDRWSAWRTMWPEPPPRVPCFPGTCCPTRAGRTLSPRTLDPRHTLPPGPCKERSDRKHCWWPQPQRRQPLGLPARALFYIFILLGGRTGFRRRTRNGLGLGYFSFFLFFFL